MKTYSLRTIELSGEEFPDDFMIPGKYFYLAEVPSRHVTEVVYVTLGKGAIKSITPGNVDYINNYHQISPLEEDKYLYEITEEQYLLYLLRYNPTDLGK